MVGRIRVALALGAVIGSGGICAAASATAADVAAQVLTALNDARARREVAPFSSPPDLQRAAERRAGEIAAMPHRQRMNRATGIGRYLEQAGIRHTFASERLLMVGGTEAPGEELVKLWQAYEDGWNAAMSPKLTQIGIGFAPAGDGWSIMLAILVEPMVDRDAKDIAALERRAFDGANRYRARHGLPALRWDDALARIARAHSEDMAARRYFEHVDPEGRGPAARVLAAGLAFSTVAENISTNRGVDDPAQTAVEGWIDSPPHRENMLLDRVSRSAVGAAAAADGAIYFTQLFFEPGPAVPGK